MATLLDALDAAVNHHMAGRTAEAERLYRLVLGIEPAQPDALHLSGVLHAQSGAPDRAVPAIRRSLRVRPEAPQPWAHLGGALRTAGRAEEAADALRNALALDPAQPDALEGLGASFHLLSDYRTARRWLERADAVRPGHPPTLLNLGTVLRDQRRFAEAEACYDAVIARAPGFDEAHLARAVGRLVQGDLRTGWEEFERRWHRFRTPPWTGEPLNGTTILLHVEQGYGDAIQFVRYAPLVAALAQAGGGRVIVETHEMLFRLFSSLPAPIQVLVRGPEPPPHDLHCPLMSLPRAFGTDLASIPAQVPYLAPEKGDVNRWRERLAGIAELKVGLVWAGNPHHRNDRNRSLAPELLRPLFAVEGVRFFSLQAGAAREDLARLPGEATDMMERVRDFADTGAILTNLDLLIAVDTAMVHLAGAIGVPAWLLLPYAPDWRWLLDRADSPWYPTLRLFRQPRPGDWQTTLATMAAVLRATTAKRRRTSPA